MNLVIVHGYLLQGTGSNIYVANIARTWKDQGHAVTVLCQDPTADQLDLVDEFIAEKDSLPSNPPEPGTLRVVIPDIDRLLPVYVFDKYDGYTVKTIPEMSKGEIELHVEQCAARLRQVCEQDADKVLANHVLFSPVITSRALRDLDIPYNVKIHGSAVEYTLVPNPELMDYAIEGLKDAQRVFTGTRYVKQRVLDVFHKEREMLYLERKLDIVPPGMDPDVFQLPTDFAEQLARCKADISTAIAKNPRGRQESRIPLIEDLSDASLNQALQDICESYDQRIADADLFDRWPDIKESDPLIVYFGKFLPAKGVGEFMMSIPAVMERIPQARFLFIGFGSFREHLEGLLQAMRDGDKDACMKFAQAGHFVEGVDFDRSFRKLTTSEAERILMTGFLTHDQLKNILPLCDVCIVSSKWPEAFGMVAVEAMAAGAFPICNYHAGLIDVVDAVAEEMSEIKALMSMDRQHFVDQLPTKIVEALKYLYPRGFADASFRKEVAKKLRRISVEKFSWGGICRRLLD